MTYIVLRHNPKLPEPDSKFIYDQRAWDISLAAYHGSLQYQVWSEVYESEHMHIFVSKETPSRITIFQRKED